MSKGFRPSMCSACWPTTASRKVVWVSASVGTARLHCYYPVGVGGLTEQRCECWNLVVPFDQRGLWAKAPKRVGVEIPRALGDRGRMRIDPQLGARRRFVVFGGVPSQMDLTDGIGRKFIDVVVSVEPHVVRADN